MTAQTTEVDPVQMAVQAWMLTDSLADNIEATAEEQTAAQNALTVSLAGLSPDQRAAYDQIIADMTGEQPVTAAAEEIVTDPDTQAWHGPLAPEGVFSGDGRKFRVGSLRWRDLPLPLSWQRETAEGHDGSVVVGRIDRIWRDEASVIQAEGTWDISDDAVEARRLVNDQMMRGVSVDVDDATIEFETRDGAPLGGDMFDLLFADEEPMMVVSDGRVSGATLCTIPAFQEAYVADGPALVTAAAQTYVSDKPWSDFTEADYTPEQWKRATILHRDPAPVPKSNHSLPVREPGGALNRNGVHAAAAALAGARGGVSATGEQKDKARRTLRGLYRQIGEDVPDSLKAQLVEAFDVSTMPPQLVTYWTKGEGAARVRWGEPGDFDRCKNELRSEGVPGHMLDGTCSNLHREAIGVSPGQEASLVASAWSAACFADPHLDGPTPLTVAEDGTVFGHLATWGTCHIGFDGQCVTPPHSASGYAYFLTGEAALPNGQSVPVGQITVGTGHAAASLGHRPAVDHYDNTGFCVADIACGDDDYGIWVAGQVRPSATPEQVAALQAGALSGDWRRIGGSLELVAALCVNVPGFPVPRVAARSAGGRPQTLVAAGMVVAEAGQVDVDMVVASAVAGTLRAMDRRRQADRLARRIGRDKRSRVARAVSVVHPSEGLL